MAPSISPSQPDSYLATCLDCQCIGANSSGIVNGEGTLRPGSRIPDHLGTLQSLVTLRKLTSNHFHLDPIFQARCPLVDGVVPPDPKALQKLNWLHFPKCGSSLTTLAYNVGWMEDLV